MTDRRQELLDRIDEAEFELLLDDYQTDLANAYLEAYEKACAAGDVPDMPEEITVKTLDFIRNYQPPAKKKRRPTVLLRCCLIAATVFATIFALLVTAQAAGYNILSMIGFWSDDEFHFGEKTDGYYESAVVSEELRHFQATLVENEIPMYLSPTWLPEGYTEVSADTSSNEIELSVWGEYSNRENTIILFVSHFLVPPDERGTAWYEKDEGDPEPYQVGDMQCSIFTNAGNWVAVWQGEIYDMFVQAPDKETLLALLDSIPEA